MRKSITAMPFGKYRGVPLTSPRIPDSYLEWAANNLSIPHVAAACRREWENRNDNDEVSREFRARFGVRVLPKPYRFERHPVPADVLLDPSAP